MLSNFSHIVIKVFSNLLFNPYFLGGGPEFVLNIYSTIGGIRFRGFGWVPVRGSFGPFWQENHSKGLCARFPARPEDGGRQGSQKKKAVNRIRGKVTVWERQMLSKELGPVDPEARMANVRGWVSVPGGCMGISLGYTLAIAHRCTDSYRKLPKLLPSCA